MNKEMHYAGMNSTRSRRKYKQAGFSTFFGKRVRHLSETEMAEFRASVQSVIEKRSAA